MSAKAEDWTGSTIKGCKILFRIGVKKNNSSVHWRAKCLKCDEEFDIRAAQLRGYEWRGHRCSKAMHGRTKDLTGLKIDNAVVLQYCGPGLDKGIQWLCKCDLCGEEFRESSLKLLEAHNEIRRRHRHKCAQPVTLVQSMPQISTDIGARMRKGKAYRKTLTFDELVVQEVIAYQRSTGAHVYLGW